jgi:hypothetical protein
MKAKSFVAVAILALGLPVFARAQAKDPSPIQRWSSRLIDNVDWVAGVWNWEAADQASGRLLALVLPLQNEAGQALGEGPLLIAGKTLRNGSTRRIVLLPANQVSADRRKRAKPFPPVPGAIAATENPPLYAIGDLIAIGAAELLKPALASDAPIHPLAMLLRQSTPATAAALAFRPDAVTRWTGALEFLKGCKRGVVSLARQKAALTLEAAFPMPLKEADILAKSVNVAARNYAGTMFDASPNAARSMDPAAWSLVQFIAGVILWPAPASADGASESLRARLQLSIDTLPELLADFINFPTARAAFEANVLARRCGCRTLFLASLAPEFRKSGFGAFRPGDPEKPAAGVQFYLDTASEGAGRAEYRLRVVDPASRLDLNNWQVNVVRRKAGWLIDWAGPYVPKR